MNSHKSGRYQFNHINTLNTPKKDNLNIPNKGQRLWEEIKKQQIERDG